MTSTEIAEPFDQLHQKYSSIYAIVSPPRGSSTAFSRVFWELPTVRYYCHEPFEVTYYQDGQLNQVLDKLQHPLDLALLPSASKTALGTALVVKEMPYQVGDHFPLLVKLATAPIIFLLRDPRLNIYSRIQKKIKVGDSPFFPLIETGWELIFDQISYCRENQIPYMLIDAADFRNHPEVIFPKVFERLDLAFSNNMLSWNAYPEVEIDNLGGQHSHLYRKVLNSRALQPATESIPSLSDFPEEQGMREHVEHCLQIFAQLLEDPHRIRS